MYLNNIVLKIFAVYRKNYIKQTLQNVLSVVSFSDHNGVNISRYITRHAVMVIHLKHLIVRY